MGGSRKGHWGDPLWVSKLLGHDISGGDIATRSPQTHYITHFCYITHFVMYFLTSSILCFPTLYYDTHKKTKNP